MRYYHSGPESGPESDSNAAVIRISQSSSITGASPSNGLMSYQDTREEVRSYRSTEMQSVYSTAQADWAGWSLNKSALSPIRIVILLCLPVCAPTFKDVSWKHFT